MQTFTTILTNIYTYSKSILTCILNTLIKFVNYCISNGYEFLLALIAGIGVIVYEYIKYDKNKNKELKADVKAHNNDVNTDIKNINTISTQETAVAQDVKKLENQSVEVKQNIETIKNNVLTNITDSETNPDGRTIDNTNDRISDAAKAFRDN